MSLQGVAHVVEGLGVRPIRLASVTAPLYAEYRRTQSGVVLWGVVGTLLVVILLLLARYLPF